MDDNQLKKALNSIGKACFVMHRELLLDTNISQKTAVAPLQIAEKGWNKVGCGFRVSYARSIVKAGRVGDAMRLVAKSRIDPALTRIAEQYKGP